MLHLPSPPNSPPPDILRVPSPQLILPTIDDEEHQIRTVPSLSELCQISVAQHLDLNADAIRSLPIDLMDKLINFMVDMLHPRSLTQTQTRPLKVRLIRYDRILTFRCLTHGTVAQAIQQIQEKCELDFESSSTSKSSSSGSGKGEYGLFQPSGLYRRARWLREDEVLSLYDIDPSETLDFKPKQTVLKLSFLGPWEKVVHPLHLSTLDTTVKTFIVDESKTVAQIAQHIARKLAIKHPEEFSLKLRQSGDDVGTWLIPDMTLPEQGIDPLNSVLLLKRQFYFDREPISLTIDRDILHFNFCQCLDAVVTATHPCSRDEAVLFAALQCQACFGDYDQSSYGPQNFDAKIRLKEFFPPEYTGSKNIWKNVVHSWIGLAGASEEKTKIGYIQLTKSLSSYGFTFFNVHRFVQSPLVGPSSSSSSSSSSSKSMSQTKSCLLGISHDTVLILDPDTKAPINRYFFTEIRKWQVLYSFFSLFFSDRKEEYLTTEAEAISSVLSTYLHHSLRNSPSVQQEFDRSFASVGRIYRSLSDRNSIGNKRRFSVDSDSGFSLDSAEFVRKCPLYIEPKKIFVNPIFGNPASGPTRYEDIIKVNKFGRMMHVLSQLSHKFIRRMSSSSATPSADSSPRTSTSSSVVVESYKEREIHVKFSDKKVKTFFVDERKTVIQITREIGRKMGIKNIEEFSLQFPQNSFNVPPPPPRPVGLDLDYYDDDECTEFPTKGLWLNPYLSLPEQNVPPFIPLLFRKKFFYNELTDDCQADPVYFHLLFCQSRDAIIDNTFACTKEEAIKLAATLFQINFGDHNPTIHKPGFLKERDLKFFLPPALPEQWGLSFHQVERAIYQEHRTLRGIKEVYAKFRYVQLCRSLKTYGATFFPVKQQQQHHQPPAPPHIPLTPTSMGHLHSLFHSHSSGSSSSSASFLSLHHHLYHSSGGPGGIHLSGGGGGSIIANLAGSGGVPLGSVKDKDKDKIMLHQDKEKDRDKDRDTRLPSGNLLLGFSRKNILFLTAGKQKKFCFEAPLSHLRRWAFNPNSHVFTLDFGDYEEGLISFFTNQGESISQYLSDYIDFIQAKIIGAQTFSETDLQLVASHTAVR